MLVCLAKLGNAFHGSEPNSVVASRYWSLLAKVSTGGTQGENHCPWKHVLRVWKSVTGFEMLTKLSQFTVVVVNDCESVSKSSSKKSGK